MNQENTKQQNELQTNFIIFNNNHTVIKKQYTAHASSVPMSKTTYVTCFFRQTILRKYLKETYWQDLNLQLSFK